jgi:hypothetical protein
MEYDAREKTAGQGFLRETISLSIKWQASK